MTTVFIGGSRQLSRLSPDACQRIDRIIENKFPIIVGDANGIDKAVQQYLLSKLYPLVEVFCSGEKCRNNLGDWPVRTIQTYRQRKDFNFYAAKDRQMAIDASAGLMIWDGKSKGTLLNVVRLLRQQKSVELYEAPLHRFWELRNQNDWVQFADRDPALKILIEQEEIVPSDKETTAV
jgi:hypothetical protein